MGSGDIDDERTRAESGCEAVAAPPAAAPAPQGRLVGRYTLLRELGRGGMGTVYSAYDEELDRKVAIKLLHHAPNGSLGAPRLLGEAQALARLSHPNVVQIYDVGELGPQVFLAMEYVQGETLREWQRGAPRPWIEVLAIYRQAGEGLAAAHAAGLVHRDVKPDNLMLGQDGRVRVMDFGLARRRSAAPPHDDPALSGSRASLLDSQQPTGGLTGTPAYMPLEQLCGAAVGAEADTFAFCVSLWEGLHGQRPFHGKSLAELRACVAHGRVTDPPADRPTPRWLRELLVRGLAPEPARRWPSLAALLAAIDRGLARTQRRRAVARASAALAGAAALVIAGVWWQRADHRARVGACEALGAEIEEAWNDPARARLRGALLGSGQSYAADSADRVLPRLDAWAAEWTRVRVETCAKEHVEREWSSDLRGRADDCLEERLLGFGAQIAELSTGGAGSVAAAVEAAASLGAPASCADPQQLARRPTLPDSGRDALREIRRALARVAALTQAGRYAEGEQSARRALADAEALGWPPVLAEARLRLGAIEVEQSRYEQAAADLEDAYFTAARASARESAADAALRLSLAVGYGLRRHAEGMRWSRLAELDLLELATGGRTALDVDWLNHRGLIHQGAGDYRESVADFRAALALAETVYGLDHPRIATYLNNIAIALGQLGELEAAQASAARSLAHVERTLGPDHPEIAVSARTLAMRTMNVARRLADPAAAAHEYARADALLERTLAISRRTFGPESIDVAKQLHPLAYLRFLRGETEGVESMMRDSIAILERHNPDDPGIAYVLTRVAWIQDALGDPAAALQTIERALAELRRLVPKDHPDATSALNTLGLIHLHLGDPAAARAPIEEAHALRQQIHAAPLVLAESLRARALLEILGGDLARGRDYLERAAADSTAGDLAEARFALAQTSWEREPDARPAALVVAGLARDGFASLGKRGDRQRLAVEAWLAARS